MSATLDIRKEYSFLLRNIGKCEYRLDVSVLLLLHNILLLEVFLTSRMCYSTMLFVALLFLFALLQNIAVSYIINAGENYDLRICEMFHK